MSDQKWEVDDIIQISPTHDERFGAALLVVTEARSWGVIGYVQIPGQGQAFFRLPYEPTEFSSPGCTVTGLKVGHAHWLVTYPEDPQ
jgi:hypothetical protein